MDASPNSASHYIPGALNPWPAVSWLASVFCVAHEHITKYFIILYEKHLLGIRKNTLLMSVFGSTVRDCSI